MTASSPAQIETPRYRLFCATWGTFSPESGLTDLPQTAGNAVALRTSLKDLDALADGGTLLHDVDGAACIDELDGFLTATDDMILYFASHGLVPSGAYQFFRLATGDTRDPQDMNRSFLIAEVIDRLARSGAGRKLVILDACYSGKAASSLLSGPAVDLDLPSDICVLFSTNPFSPALARANEPLTAFTGSLTELLVSGLPQQGPELTVRSIYSHLRAAAEGSKSPQPWLVSTGSSAETITFRNVASPAGGDAADVPYGELVEAFEHRTEILYVDDQQLPRERFRTELERAGHRVTIASDPDEGERALATGYFDIVVIDLLLDDDTPATDFIKICTDRAPESLIFLVSRLTRSSTENWKRLDTILAYKSRISAFLWKPECVQAIEEHANRLRDSRRHVLGHIGGLDESVALVAERLIARDSNLEAEAERLRLEVRACVERLVEKWFPMDNSAPVYIESMKMGRVDGGRSSSLVFTLVPTLRGIEAESVTPLIVKLGPAKEITREVVHYDRYVEVGVPLDFRTDKLADAIVGKVGGIVYSFRGADDNAIHDVAGLPTDEIDRCLERLFGKDSPKRWHASKGTGDGVTPIAHFERLGYPLKRFEKAFDELDSSLKKLATDLPSDAAIEATGLRAVFEDQMLSHDATLVHGDLTLDNIVQISDGRFAIIDYSTVGLGPRLIDFATLEISCWLLARGPNMTRQDRFLDALGAVPRRLRATDEDANLEAADWLGESFRLARKCREIALVSHSDATGEEYGALLWLAAVRLSEFRSRRLTTGERNTHRALLPAVALAAQVMIGE